MSHRGVPFNLDTQAWARTSGRHQGAGAEVSGPGGGASAGASAAEAPADVARLWQALGVAPVVWLWGASAGARGALLATCTQELSVTSAWLMALRDDTAGTLRSRLARTLRRYDVDGLLARHAMVIIIEHADVLAPAVLAALLAGLLGRMPEGSPIVGQIILSGKTPTEIQGRPVAMVGLDGSPHELMYAATRTAAANQPAEGAASPACDVAAALASADADMALAAAQALRRPLSLAACQALGCGSAETWAALWASGVLDPRPRWPHGHVVIPHSVHAALATKFAAWAIDATARPAMAWAPIDFAVEACFHAALAEVELPWAALFALPYAAAELWPHAPNEVRRRFGFSLGLRQRDLGLLSLADVAAQPLDTVGVALFHGRLAVAQRLLSGMASSLTPDGMAMVLALLSWHVRLGVPCDVRWLAQTPPWLQAAARGMQALAGGASAEASMGLDNDEAGPTGTTGALAQVARTALLAALREAPATPSLTLQLRLASVEALFALNLIDAGEGELHAIRSELGGLDLPALAEAAEALQAEVRWRQGQGDLGFAILTRLAEACRRRGDDVHAMAFELRAAEFAVELGQVRGALHLIGQLRIAVQRLAAPAWGLRLELMLAQLEALEFRWAEAAQRLARVVPGQVASGPHAASEVELWEGLREAARWAQGAGTTLRDAPGPGSLTALVWRAEAAFWTGDAHRADGLATQAVAEALRQGRRALSLRAQAVVVRLLVARGDRGPAATLATQLALDAADAGHVRVRLVALHVLGSLALAEGEPHMAMPYFVDGAELASQAGLSVERLLFSASLAQAIGQPMPELRQPGLSEAAVRAVTRVLAMMGMSADRPFAMLDADGVVQELVDASPQSLRVAMRSLAIDGVRDVLWRRGLEVADLRRRSLLKKLLFLFARSPGQDLSKEAIVSHVWNVAYHPLRHDAALFTNIMRLRRMMGEDGAAVIRATELGYRFEPPSDFIYVFSRERAGRPALA